MTPPSLYDTCFPSCLLTPGSPHTHSHATHHHTAPTHFTTTTTTTTNHVWRRDQARWHPRGQCCQGKQEGTKGWTPRRTGERARSMVGVEGNLRCRHARQAYTSTYLARLGRKEGRVSPLPTHATDAQGRVSTLPPSLTHTSQQARPPSHHPLTPVPPSFPPSHTTGCRRQDCHRPRDHVQGGLAHRARQRPDAG